MSGLGHNLRSAKYFSILAGPAILLVAFATFVDLKKNYFISVQQQICGLVSQQYFLQGQELNQWVEDCRVQPLGGIPSAMPLSDGTFHEPSSTTRWASSVFFKKENFIDQMNRILEQLGSSHLQIYSPQAGQAVWENIQVDNGLRVRRFSDEYLVMKVLPGSSADKKELRRGDVLLKVNGRHPKGLQSILDVSGEFEVRRFAKHLRVNLVAEELHKDLAMTINKVAGVGVLRIPSFLPQYFSDESLLRQKMIQLQGTKKIVIDLRGNAGGSFPGMLRVLSYFFCSSTEIGELFHPAGSQGDELLPNDLRAETQLETLNRAKRVYLKTFVREHCLSQKLNVLIDQETGSVAEIFAQALKEQRQARTFGMNTSGQVVMAQWFPLSILGSSEYYISIPVAGFLSHHKRKIEGEGVSAQIILDYQLELEKQGRDSWVEAALQM